MNIDYRLCFVILVTIILISSLIYYKNMTVTEKFEEPKKKIRPILQKQLKQKSENKHPNVFFVMVFVK